MNAKLHHVVPARSVQPDPAPDDVVRPPAAGSALEPLMGAPSAQGGLPTVALPSDQPGNPEPGLAAEQEGPF